MPRRLHRTFFGCCRCRCPCRWPRCSAWALAPVCGIKSSCWKTRTSPALDLQLRSRDTSRLCCPCLSPELCGAACSYLLKARGLPSIRHQEKDQRQQRLGQMRRETHLRAPLVQRSMGPREDPARPQVSGRGALRPERPGWTERRPVDSSLAKSDVQQLGTAGQHHDRALESASQQAQLLSRGPRLLAVRRPHSSETIPWAAMAILDQSPDRATAYRGDNLPGSGFQDLWCGRRGCLGRHARIQMRRRLRLFLIQVQVTT